MIMVSRRHLNSGIRAVSTSNAGAQTSSVTVPAPSGIVAGNMLYAFAVYDSLNSTPPGTMASSGWTEHTSINFTTHNNYGYITGFYKVATSSEPTSYVFTGASVNACSVVIVQLSGLNSSTPFGTPVTKNCGNTATATFGTVSLTGTSAVLIGAAQAGNYSASVANAITWGPGFKDSGDSTSQYNSWATYDSEVVMSALNTGVGASSFTPQSATWNKAYYTGTIVVPLKV